MAVETHEAKPSHDRKGARRWLLGPVAALIRFVADARRPLVVRALAVFGAGTGVCSLGFGLLLLYLLLLVPFTPGRTEILEAAHRRASVVVDAAGSEITRFDAAHRRWVDLEDVSPHVVAALVSTEDHRFFSHNGIDYRRLLSSVAYTLTGDLQGGSTITMQLSRNLYPDAIGNAFGPNRKCKELVTARKIESVYSKEEILELYLNTVPFLYGVRGIEMAAQTYFSKRARDLSVAESATLVGMLKATSWYNPVRHPERSRARRDVVIAQMLKHARVDSATAARASADPVKTRFSRPSRRGSRAPHFADRVERLATEWARRNNYDLYADGLTIETSLDLRLQGFAETAVRRQGDALQRVANVEWSTAQARLRSTDIRDYAAFDRQTEAFNYLWSGRQDLVLRFVRESAAFRTLIDGGMPADEAERAVRNDEAAMAAIRATKGRLEAGFVALDPRNGHVLAWVGSRDYVQAPFDHVAASRRQAGSTFKPVVYAAALEDGLAPDDLVPNDDIEFRVGRDDVWRLASSDNAPRYVTLREGLARSHNNVAAQLIDRVGVRKTAALARKLGVTDSNLDEVPSLALGTSPVSLLEMASVYATIAAEGVYTEPTLIVRIKSRTGEVLFEADPGTHQAISVESARYLTDMLRDVVGGGTGQRIRYQFGVPGDLGGKTGTTQNNMDGWFMLIHPHVVAGAWVGFDDPRVTFRTDFWGEGAHNALFVVGDVFRQASAHGALDRQARFTDPPAPQIRYPFTHRASNWFDRQFGRIADAFRSEDDAPADDSRRRARYRPEWEERTGDTRREPDRRSDDRMQAYERLRQRIAEGLESGDGLADRIIDAYRRERDSNPDLRELERELDVRVRRWLEEAEERLAELERD